MRVGPGIRACTIVACALLAAALQGLQPAEASIAAAHGIVLSVAPIPTDAHPSPGTPQVTWSSGDGSPAEVTVTPRGGKEALFASGPNGTAPAPWIAPGMVYVFRLYSLVSGRRLLAQLQVGHATTLKLLALPRAPASTSAFVDRVLQLLSFASVALLAVLTGMHVREVRRRA